MICIKHTNGIQEIFSFSFEKQKLQYRFHLQQHLFDENVEKSPRGILEPRLQQLRK
jgi:hypothetical protein